MRKIFAKTAGLSLIEMMIATSIAIITIVAAISLYIFYWRTFVIGNNILDVYANSRVAMGYISKDVRASSQIVSSHGSYTTSDNSIVLRVPSINAQGDRIGSYYDYIIYMLSGNNLIRVIDSDPVSSRIDENRTIANYCSSLTFSSGGVTLSNVSNLSTVSTVAIYLPLNKATISLSGSGSETVSMIPTTIIRLRNK